jgi:DNA processing protein
VTLVTSTDPRDPDRLAWLRLARSRGLGGSLFFHLIERYGKAAAVIKALPTLEAKLAPKGFALASEASIMDEIETLERLGAVHLLADEPAYPAALRNIADPPPVLTLLGRIELLAGRDLAIVGARNASGNGRYLATQLARELSDRGLTVVSGLARGIDTAAHQGGLDGPGSTIAVLGSGIDIVYPPENAELQARIAAAGLLVSERAPGTPPLARHFPRRNRIIAGLASAVLVVEAASRSGSLMTARLAAAEGREVMAVPGSPLDPRHAGTNQLLRDGAALVTGIEDVMAALPAWTTSPAEVAKPSQPAPRVSPKRSSPQPLAEPTARAGTAVSGTSGSLPDHIATLLGVEPMPVDEVIRQCHASPSAVQNALLDLELDGRLRRHPGNRISRALA